MFSVSSPFLLFDYFRVPSEPADETSPAPACPESGALAARLSNTADPARTLFWIPVDSDWRGRVTGSFLVRSQAIFGAVLPDVLARRSLERLGGDWRPTLPIERHGGGSVAAIWTDAAGRIFLPFDPNELILRFWSESYNELISPPHRRLLRSTARRSYYRFRRLVPRETQLVARRWFSRIQSKRRFPAWPVETALHDFYALLFELVGSLVSEPVPIIAPWPEGYSWAFVLTHDVETAAGCDSIAILRDIELDRDYRSSWNFVPRNHHAPLESTLRELRQTGFEVGVHGLRHDGRDISDHEQRFPLLREYAQAWDAVGFRSPATLRDWNVMPRLELDYDSSYSDTAPYEPQPGGCCSWLPYLIEDLVELPITLPQDHTLFEILGGFDEQLWLEKATFLRDRGGMALVLTHPDYAENHDLVSAYRSLLVAFEDDASAWKALPRDVSSWWRERAASSLSRTNGAWTIVGPAAEAGTVAFAGSRS